MHLTGSLTPSHTGFMAFQASRWNDLCGWHRCCSDPDFSFNYWIYLAVLIMAMKSPISLCFSCTPQPILRPWDNVAIHAAVRYSFLVLFLLSALLWYGSLRCSSTKPLRSFWVRRRTAKGILVWCMVCCLFMQRSRTVQLLWIYVRSCCPRVSGVLGNLESFQSHVNLITTTVIYFSEEKTNYCCDAFPKKIKLTVTVCLISSSRPAICFICILCVSKPF